MESSENLWFASKCLNLRNIEVTFGDDPLLDMVPFWNSGIVILTVKKFIKKKII